MVEVILNPYDIFTTPISHLSSLEDVILVGYDTKDEMNKPDHISITSYPALLFPAIKNIRRENTLSISYIERISILYAVSLLSVDPIMKELHDNDLTISSDIEDEDILCSIDNIKKLDYCTRTKTASTSISVLSWCKDWMVSAGHNLELTASQIAIYCLCLGISKYNLKNQIVKGHIEKEVIWFKKHIVSENNRRKIILDI